MSKMKPIFVAVFVSLSIHLGCAANPKNSMSEDKLADLMIQKMEKDVQLSDEQKLTMKTKLVSYIINVQNASKLPNNETKKNKMQEIDSKHHASIDSLLTTDQLQNLKLKVSQRKNSKK